MPTVNLASKYSNKVDERFRLASQAAMVTNNDYEFTGVETVKVYSIPVVAMNDYHRTGSNRYGNPSELGNNIQSMTVTRDRSWTFTIDKGNKIQSQMVMDAGKACARQIAEVVIPEYDSYVFGKISLAGYNTVGHHDSTAADKTNAYELFLAGQEALGNDLAPDAGRVALCSYAFANFLKQDPAFMRYGDASQEMIRKGIIGEVDGTKVVKVPKSRLPYGCNFIITHPVACCAPRQLDEYKIHTDAPGYSGWLCEGRVLYDAFILNEKAAAIYYSGTSALGTSKLSALAVKVGGTALTLTPTFDGATTTYTASTSGDSAVVEATAESGDAILEVFKGTDAQGTAKRTITTDAITLASGDNVLTVKATSTLSGETKTYTVTVTKS